MKRITITAPESIEVKTEDATNYVTITVTKRRLPFESRVGFRSRIANDADIYSAYKFVSCYIIGWDDDKCNTIKYVLQFLAGSDMHYFEKSCNRD